ncbi:MAG: fumarylacetoacetate hydrolase, partial [Mesorhizobium sp.]
MTNPTHLPSEGLFVGRARSGDVSHPMVVTVRDGTVFDITSSAAPTVRDVCELADPAGHVGSAKGTPIGSVSDIAANSLEATRDPAKPFLLSPVDLQAIKASGVTFVVSLLERVIEEQARGSAEKADAIRADIAGLIGHDLSKLKPGSPEAMEIKAKLISRGAWSQYLE